MKYKYAVGLRPEKIPQRRSDPNKWLSGPDPYQHELFYAWHKHRSQARFRKEEYNLTFEDWQLIWINPADFLNRGRQPEDLVLTRKDHEGAWSIDNCHIITRYEALVEQAIRFRGRKNKTYRGVTLDQNV